MRKILFWLVSLVLVVTPFAPAGAVGSPQPPVNLVVTSGMGEFWAADNMALFMNWERNANQGTETGWDIYVSYDGGVNYVLYKSNLAVNFTTYNIYPITANRVFYVKIWGTDGLNQSDVPLTGGPFYSWPYVSPADVSFQTQTSYKISWEGEAKEYKLQNVDSSQEATWQVEKYKIFNNLSCGRTTNFSLTARNQIDVSAPGNVQNFTATTLPCDSGLNAPVISDITDNTAKITIDPTGLPADTTYVIFENAVYGKYLNAYNKFALDEFGMQFKSYNAWGGANGVVATGLAPNTTYSVSLLAKNAAGVRFIDGPSTSFTTLNTPPNSVRNLTATSSGNQTINLSWTGTGATYNAENITLGSSSGWSSLTNYSFTGLTCNTPYSFKVTPRDPVFNLGTPATINATTLPCDPAPTVSSVTTAGSTQNSISLSWVANATASVLNVNTGVSSGARVQPNYTFTNLTCGTTYNFQVVATNGAGQSSAPYNHTATTAACSAPPTTVSNITTSNITASGLTLNWAGTGATYNAENITTAISSGWSAVNSYSFSGLTCNTTYQFRITPRSNLQVAGTPSTISATTAACPNNQITPAMLSFRATQNTKTSVSLSWSGLNITQYNVSNSTDGTSSGWTVGTEYTFNNLSCGKTYLFSVLGKSADGTLSVPVVVNASTQNCDGQQSNNGGVNLPASCPALSPQDMIKVTGKPAIYALTDKYEVRYFASGDEFKSWNENDSYSGRYKTVSQSCFDGLSLPAAPPYHIFFRPGSYIIRPAHESGNLYVVEPGNTVTKITAGAATTLYGQNYSVKVVGLSEWSLYAKSGRTITNAKPHAGMLVRANGKVWYVTEELSLREVTADGKLENRFKDAFIRTLSSASIGGYPTASPVIGYESSLSSRLGL